MRPCARCLPRRCRRPLRSHAPSKRPCARVRRPKNDRRRIVAARSRRLSDVPSGGPRRRRETSRSNRRLHPLRPTTRHEMLRPPPWHSSPRVPRAAMWPSRRPPPRSCRIALPRRQPTSCRSPNRGDARSPRFRSPRSSRCGLLSSHSGSGARCSTSSARQSFGGFGLDGVGVQGATFFPLPVPLPFPHPESLTAVGSATECAAILDVCERLRLANAEYRVLAFGNGTRSGSGSRDCRQSCAFDARN